MAEMSLKEGWKAIDFSIKSNKKSVKKTWPKNHDFFFEFSHVFQPSFDDIDDENWWNFKNLMRKLGPEVEIYWKKWDLWPRFLE
jgi:hypothetical protein